MSRDGSRKRRKWSAAEKLRIVLKGMESGVEVSALCRAEGISPVQYYAWKKQLQTSASLIFEDKRGRRSEPQERLESENTRLKSVIAEITAENLDLKKGRWG